MVRSLVIVIEWAYEVAMYEFKRGNHFNLTL